MLVSAAVRRAKSCSNSVKAYQLAWIMAIAILLGGVPIPVSAERVWGEGNIATVFLGMNPINKSPVHGKLMLVALGPDIISPSSSHDRFAYCMREAVVRIAESPSTWRTLDLSVDPWSKINEELKAAQRIDVESLNAARAARLGDVSRVFADARKRFLGYVRSCQGLQSTVASTARLAIVNRICIQNSKRPCTGKDYLFNPNYSSASRYSKVFEWFQSAGVRGENDFLELGNDAKLTPVVVRHELYPDKPWPSRPTAAEAQEAFETGAVWLRGTKAKYDYIAPRVVGLPKEAGYRLVDVISHPSLSIPMLGASPPGTSPLLTISDEIARSRIAECVLLRAKQTAIDAGDCAGYSLDSGQLASCMNGTTCLPDLMDEAPLSSLEFASVRTRQQLLNTSLPRLSGKETKWTAYEASATLCKKEPTPARATLCMIKESLSTNDQNSFDCATTVAAKRSGVKGAAQCLAEGLEDGLEKKIVSCAAVNPNDPKAIALCVALPNAPPFVQHVAACMEQYMESGRSSEIARCVTPNDPLTADALKAAECGKKHPANWKAAAVCFASGKLPEGSEEAVECANSATDYKKFAGCVITTKVFGGNVGGDAGRLINCAAQSGGDNLGTIACMAGSSLTPEQQIALQCAAQSPDLITFAGCTGGQLSLREFGKCQGREFGDDVCFGPNNEIRKFLKNVNVNVSEDTVVGQVAGAPLKVLQAQVAFAESAGKDLTKTGEQVFKVAQGIAETGANIVTGLLDAGRDVVDGLRRILSL